MDSPNDGTAGLTAHYSGTPIQGAVSPQVEPEMESAAWGSRPPCTADGDPRRHFRFSR
jgi:hypothetical protein